MKQHLSSLSTRYTVRPLTQADIPELLSLCEGNPTYYAHMHTQPTAESLREDLTRLPPRKTAEDKYFLGFCQEGRLAAVLDLITAYPNPETAFVGWFMVRRDLQGRGIGTALVDELLDFLREEGFHSVRLGRVKGNPESEFFWQKNGFTPTGIETEAEGYTIVVMQRAL